MTAARSRVLAARPLVTFLVIVVFAGGLASAPAAAQVVTMFPWPGTTTASPKTQISVRGVVSEATVNFVVEGALSGRHSGTIKAHSDRRGVSFIPDSPFTPGETVTVKTKYVIAGANERTASFTVAVPYQRVHGRVTTVREAQAGTRSYTSMPGVPVPAMTVRTPSRDLRSGVVLLTCSFGPSGSGPLVVDHLGNTIWFKPLPNGVSAMNLRSRTFRGKRVLTWWEGASDRGKGQGEHLIVDERYRQMARVRAGNGYQADFHEFVLAPDGTAYVIVYNWVWHDIVAAPGPAFLPTIEAVVQRIDVATGLVLFEWHSLDHVGVDESYLPVSAASTEHDYFHLNSVEIDRDGNLLLSARHTSTVYKIDSTTGAVLWRLGGKRSDFSVDSDARFAHQHSARRRADGLISLFDNGAGPLNPFADAEYSSGLLLRVDEKRRTASLAGRFVHPERVLSTSQGNLFNLDNGGLVVGWGSQSYVTQFDAAGGVVFEGVTAPWQSYRAFRQLWSGFPDAQPNVVASKASGWTNVYVSWNGDGRTRTWELLAGSTPGSLRPVTRVTRRGFETFMRTSATHRYVQVRAYDAQGHRLVTSSVRAV